MTRKTMIVPMTRSHVRACDAITKASDPWMTLEERIDFAKYIRAKQAFVCTTGDEVTGYVIFTPESVFARGGYLRAIAVAQELRGRGVGKKLMAFAERQTAHLSEYLYLCVSSFNRQGQAFYKRLGYSRAGMLHGLIRPGSAEYIYWKRLRPLKKTRSR